MKNTEISARLLKIADASRREDGSDIPLGQELRLAASHINQMAIDAQELLGLVSEAKGLGGPAVVDHLDAAESILRKYD